jgi:hypothetical protein
MKIYTHLNVDLDAVASVWAVQTFIPGAADAEIAFVPANWDGVGFETGDIAVDLNAGGHGIKGKQMPSGAVMSAFDSVMLEYAPIAAQQALAHLRRFVDVQDSTGSVVKTLLPEAPRELQEMFAATGINAVLRALQATYKGMDTPVLAIMSSIFQGMLIAGEHGIKGLQLPSGAVMSVFDAIMPDHAPIEAQQALANLRRFVDVQVSSDSAVETLLPEAPRELQEMFAATGINAVLRALQAVYKGMDTPVLATTSSIFQGMMHACIARQRAAIEAEAAEIIQKPGAKVAIVRDGKEYGTNGVLYDDHGVDAVVYVDGTNLGITRKGDCQIPMDHPKIRVVVEAAQEASEWFAHPAKYLYCRGSRKAPAETPSKVDPRQLAEAVLSAFPDPE